MEKEKKKLIIPEGHARPRTRRDFLKYGLIPVAGQILMPTLLTSLLTSKRAFAGDKAGSGYIPFLVFDMAGGAALPGNFLVGQAGGPEDLCSDYSKLGWDPRGSDALDKSFGLPMAKNASQLLAGMRQGASAEALANLRMGSFCHFSQDDTSSNQISALTLVAHAGLRGRFIPQGVGARNSISGGNSDAALKEAQYKPLFVQSTRDIQEAISHGPAFESFDDDHILSLSRLIVEMSAEQIRNIPNNEKLIESAGNGYGRMQTYGKTIAGLDPTQDQNATQVYGLNRGGNPQDENQIFGSIAHNVLRGNTGPGAITIGDFDYHNKGQKFADGKDLEMGVQIGRAVELAHRTKTPLFFQILTDGGVSAKSGSRDWEEDSNVRSMTVIGFYHPTRPPEQRRLQVGEYTAKGVVNQDNPLIGGGADQAPLKVADAVLANYLAACGKIGEYEKSSNGKFRNMEIDQVLIFG